MIASVNCWNNYGMMVKDCTLESRSWRDHNIFLKCAKGRLKLSWSLMTVWRRLEPLKRTPPWCQKRLLAVVGVCLSRGWDRYGFTLMIGFDAVLRTGEMLHLRSGHLFLMDAIHALSGSAQVLIYLGVTKTGHRDNRLDAVKLECPKLWALISRF